MCKKRIAFHTLGCKLNFAETSGLSRQLQQNCQLVGFGDEAEIYVIHTCAVTSTAEKKCRAMIRQAHKRNPKASIFVLGCMSQLKASKLAEMEGVTMVLGNAEKYQLNEIIENENFNPEHKVSVGDILKSNVFNPAYSGSDRTRTFVKIQDGCDYYCTYCTIPFARGKSRSESIQKTIELIKVSLNEDPREIVLTGVNIGDFGKPGKESFAELLEGIEMLNTGVRFRLSSIEPDLLSEEIIRLIAGSKKFMPHFHIPLQSGSNTVLKRMNRRYQTDTFVNLVNQIKSLLPYACIAADVIVGFPGESEMEFQETVSLIRGLPLSYLHIFPFSERPGTKASTFPDKLHPQTIQQRVASLSELSLLKKRVFLDENKGRIEEVLFESEDINGFISGFTRNYLRVKAPFRNEFVNCVLKTRLNKTDNQAVFFYEPVTDQLNNTFCLNDNDRQGKQLTN